MTLKFHKSVYPLSAVRKAAADFSELASVRVSSQGSYHIAALVPRAGTHEASIVRGNFLNYCLILAKSSL